MCPIGREGAVASKVGAEVARCTVGTGAPLGGVLGRPHAFTEKKMEALATTARSFDSTSACKNIGSEVEVARLRRCRGVA